MSEHVVNDLDKLNGIGPKYSMESALSTWNRPQVLNGIGPKYKEMHKSIGVDSIKELRSPQPGEPEGDDRRTA